MLSETCRRFSRSAHVIQLANEREVSVNHPSKPTYASQNEATHEKGAQPLYAFSHAGALPPTLSIAPEPAQSSCVTDPIGWLQSYTSAQPSSFQSASRPSSRS